MEKHPSLPILPPPHWIELEGAQLEVQHLPAPGSQPGKPTLVFLHEGLGSVAMWHQKGRHWPSELAHATGCNALIYSRRGYGRSSAIPDVRGPHQKHGLWHRGRHTPRYMHHEALEVLPRLLAQLNIDRPVLVGHSDGATIALLYAAHRPVLATVAMAPHSWVEDLAIEAIEQAKQLFMTTDLKIRLGRYHDDVEGAFWQWNDVWLSEAFRTFDIRETCRSITQPLLLVQGREDEYGTLNQLKALQVAVPHAQSCVLESCGHSPHRDQPYALTQAVLGFLAGAGLASSPAT